MNERDAIQGSLDRVATALDHLRETVVANGNRITALETSTVVRFTHLDSKVKELREEGHDNQPSRLQQAAIPIGTGGTGFGVGVLIWQILQRMLGT